MSFLPDNEVELREGKHDDPQQGRECSMNDRGKHVLQRQENTTVTRSDASNKALEYYNYQFDFVYAEWRDETHHENVNDEFHSDANGKNKYDGGNCAEFDAKNTHSPKQLSNYATKDDKGDSRGPWGHEQDARDDKDGGKCSGKSQKKVKSQPEVLFPKCEWDSVGEIWQTQRSKFVANLPNTVNCFNHGFCVAKVVKKEWNLGVLDWL